MPSPNYYAVITAEVLYDKNLKHGEKLLYAMISGFTGQNRYCYASDKYFAERLGTSQKSIKRYLKSLKEKGYISIETTRVGILWYRQIYLCDI